MHMVEFVGLGSGPEDRGGRFGGGTTVPYPVMDASVNGVGESTS